MLAGAAQTTITPQHPIELWGYGARTGKSRGVHDDLFAKVLVLDAGGLFVLVMLDLGGVSREIGDIIKRRLASELAVSESRIAVTATHTHAAPAATPFRGCRIDDRYIRFAVDRIVQAARQAVGEMTEATVGYARFCCDLNVNRTERGAISDRAQPSGTVDSNVSLVRIDRATNGPAAILINYAMHPVTLRANNLHVSADYPGVTCATVAEEVDAVVGFLQGCAGDLNPKKWGDRDDMRDVGRALGQEVVRHLDDAKPLASPAIAVQTREVALPVRKIALDSVKERIAKYEKQESHARDFWSECDYRWAVEYSDYCRTADVPSTMPSLVQVVAIGPLRLVFLPGEPLSRVCTTLRSRFADLPLVVSAYSNDASVGYIPGPDDERHGGYEVDEAFKFYGLFPLGGEAEAVLADTCSRMLHAFEER